jgi:hypothetical protein
MESGYAKAEVRNETLRQGLTPLGKDEHPTPLKIAIAVAALLGLLNVGLLLAGVEVQDSGKGNDDGSSAGGVVVLSLLLVVAAVGMYRHQAWATLGFLVLVAITVVFASLSLMVASNLLAVAVCVPIIVLGGWLFWKLIRVLGRMQVPRPGVGEPNR